NVVPKVAPATFGRDAVLYGAIALALRPPVELVKIQGS
ncbi:ROK family protein, partial [Candidatus Bathyarchaeota archaeon]